MISDKQFIRLTKEFRFECAHALTGYDGKCSRIHGHSYKLLVTIKGMTCSAKNGMVIDFRDIKSMVESSIIDKFDHSLVLSNEAPLASELKESYPNVILLDGRPTCENLILLIVRTLKGQMESDFKFKDFTLQSVRLWETNTSYAEWCEEDNR